MMISIQVLQLIADTALPLEFLRGSFLLILELDPFLAFSEQKT